MPYPTPETPYAFRRLAALNGTEAKVHAISVNIFENEEPGEVIRSVMKHLWPGQYGLLKTAGAPYLNRRHSNLAVDVRWIPDPHVPSYKERPFKFAYELQTRSAVDADSQDPDSALWLH